MKVCSIEGCDRPVNARGWCKPHYRRWARWGDSTYDALTLVNRLDRKINRTLGCWLWTGALNDMGYPQIQQNGTRRYAHRIMHELHIGPIPEGYDIDHLCSTPACVRPSHLEAVTRSENMKRMWQRGERERATHCKHGHEFTADNTYRQAASGGRGCVTCRRREGRNRYRVKAGIPLEAPVLRERSLEARMRIRRWREGETENLLDELAKGGQG